MASLRGLCLRRVSGANTISCHLLLFACGPSRRLGCGFLASAYPSSQSTPAPVTPSTHPPTRGFRNHGSSGRAGPWPRGHLHCVPVGPAVLNPREGSRSARRSDPIPGAEGQSPNAMGPWYEPERCRSRGHGRSVAEGHVFRHSFRGQGRAGRSCLPKSTNSEPVAIRQYGRNPRTGGQGARAPGKNRVKSRFYCVFDCIVPAQVYLRISSTVVSPSKMAWSPSSRRVRIPSSIAFCRSTTPGARWLIISRRVSLRRRVS